eukprot:scaffold1375_cov137-Cylindrotheca_fusiformis.AAC.8
MSSGFFSYVTGYWSGTATNVAETSGVAANGGVGSSSSDPASAPTPVASNGPSEGAVLNETTSLLESVDETADPGIDVLHPLSDRPPSAHELYFSPSNPTVQRYYRFSATPITPIVALHKKPGTGNSAIINSGVTGLLRRSAVVPSHGTDETGDWILVSVGGRSGWARKKEPNQHFSGFTLAETFNATEGWMGNHAFLCKGKLMLGSDAPSLFFTNILLLVGYILQFCLVVPKLMDIEAEGSNPIYEFIHVDGIFWASVAAAVLSFVFLWVSALMDPGIIPPVSSPIKAPPPPSHVPIGGPLGYRYCSTCNIFRPPRSKHCNSCNVCVSKFDQYVQPCIV